MAIGLGIPLAISERAYMFPVVMIAGAIGGFISLQRRLKQLTDSDRELLADSWLYVCLAPFAGGVLACVLYLIFLSGLLAGQIFPKFYFDPLADKAVGLTRLFHMYSTDPAEYAKLLFWSFLAGFSEKFVTNIISTFDKVPRQQRP